MFETVLNAINTLSHASTNTQGVSRTGRLMRVNYAGEIAAQGLYSGAKAFSTDSNFQDFCTHAIQEERVHLDWCLERMNAHYAKPSVLNPVIFCSAFVLGAASSIPGKQYALAFIEETERQVLKHLESHLRLVPRDDERTREVLMQMIEDESMHKDAAAESGAATLPGVVSASMQALGGVLTNLTFWV
ncbi:demethoxyubiquinone hydroxylase family protein [Candidatus Comchoanobacter bicostacola]|uniref:Demethoxyubiquinone hydroxylase family protein n=1 Tax=Candidatus Comchoanobacter bicostacola TaxID=2919598 RepID=A0ABY5DLM9_9GAMM|nr:demethoxyubiquinone hydroxylase family protein [Candidatus Comchoanobacter bicostacola]UTC24544.1 demethoxyubiquinone hydroxylase family protein [Candidatus Comchoanobacter bicostacola]